MKKILDAADLDDLSMKMVYKQVASEIGREITLKEEKKRIKDIATSLL